MAREDFCFTWYDGDAARDMQHMNRLARGAYYDLVSFQRKVGPFTIDQARGILNKDFEECWPVVSLILKQDGEGKYFIEWVVTSMNRTRKNSKTNKERVAEYWRKVVAGEIIHNARGKKNQLNTENIPRNNSGINSEVPYENGIEYEYGLNEVKEEGVGETAGGVVPDMLQQFKAENPKYLVDRRADYPELWQIARKIHSWLELPAKPEDKRNSMPIRLRWGELVKHIRGDSHLCKYSIAQINKHFQSIVQSFSNGSKRTDKSSRTSRTVEALLSGLDTGDEIN